MKTFKQYLAESNQDLIEFLENNCGPALNDFAQAGEALWRGVDHADNKQHDLLTFKGKTFNCFTGAPRPDRRPRNTPRWAHDAIEDWFEVNMGERIRSTTLFANANKTSVRPYGTPYAIFPIGDYDIYWSPEIADLTTEFWPDDEDELPGGTDNKDDAIEYIKDGLDGAGYKHGDNIEALHTGNNIGGRELMIKCDKYLALDVTKEQLRQILEACQGDM